MTLILAEQCGIFLEKQVPNGSWVAILCGEEDIDVLCDMLNYRGGPPATVVPTELLVAVRKRLRRHAKTAVSRGISGISGSFKAPVRASRSRLERGVLLYSDPDIQEFQVTHLSIPAQGWLLACQTDHKSSDHVFEFVFVIEVMITY